MWREIVSLSEIFSPIAVLTGRGEPVAVGNRVVPKREWQEFIVEDGMKVTVIKAVCGG